MITPDEEHMMASEVGVQPDRPGGPAPRPCVSCPYRTDVPSAVWAPSEYEKLVAYDADTGEQPAQLFLCHQHDRDSAHRRLCAGWVGCHGEELLALRLGVLTGEIDETTYRSAVDYVSPVELFDSGAQAAAHGVRDNTSPGDDARAVIAKLQRRRGDVA